MLNHGSVDPYPHITWKLESHVELFNKVKSGIGWGNKVDINSVLTFIAVLREKY